MLQQEPKVPLVRALRARDVPARVSAEAAAVPPARAEAEAP